MEYLLGILNWIKDTFGSVAAALVLVSGIVTAGTGYLTFKFTKAWGEVATNYKNLDTTMQEVTRLHKEQGERCDVHARSQQTLIAASQSLAFEMSRLTAGITAAEKSNVQLVLEMMERQIDRSRDEAKLLLAAQQKAGVGASPPPG